MARLAELARGSRGTPVHGLWTGLRLRLGSCDDRRHIASRRKKYYRCHRDHRSVSN
jgi:hypothetical protein